MKKLSLLLMLLFAVLPAFAQSSPSYGSGFTSAGLTLNGKAAINGTRLRLTDGGTGEASSAYFNTPVNVQSFTNDFSFQLTSATADGFTFTIQGNSPTALGPVGGGLGYGPSHPGGTPGTGKSVAVKFDLYSNAGEGTDSTGSYINGASPTTPSVDLTGTGIDLHSGDVMNVHMSYDGTTLTWTITDPTAGTSFTTSAAVNIPLLVGATTGYVGFTGGTGGLTAIQDILTWTYGVATPTFSPAGGTYTASQLVTIADTTAGALIYYTMDGSTPTNSSTQYSGPIPVSSTTTIKAIAAASGMTNSAVATATYSIQTSGGGSSPSYGSGFTSAGLALNGHAAINGTRLRLTDGGAGETSSAFFNTPVNVQSFTNDFNFQLTSATADGFTFTIQGNSPNALGLGGGSLGYGPNKSGALGIGKSVAVKLDLYSNAGEGADSTGSYINGASPTIPSQDMTSSGVDLHSGDVMNVHMSYDGTTLTWAITDPTAGTSFTTSAIVNIPSLVGGTTGYVGFTGGTGGLTAIEDILSWTYVASAGAPEQVATPTFSPTGGIYTASQLQSGVTISDTTSGALIYYTRDGSTPTTASTLYSGPIAVGSTTTIKSIAAASGMTNSAVATATYTIQSSGGGSSPSYGSGFTSTGLTLNNGTAINGTRLRLTDGGAGEARSAFFSTPVNVQSFITDFTFQLTNANADGFTFTIQNNSSMALGVAGGSLGYGPNGSSSGGIPNSIAVKFDLYSNAGEGTDSTGLYKDGASPTVPATDMTSSGVNLHSGDIMTAHLAYDGTTLSLIVTDTNTNASFGTGFTVNIPGTVGANTAYVGFTGGTGGLTATQDILNWTYNAVGVSAFAWPVNTPITYANGSSGGPNDYSTYDGPAPIFGSYHTGIDVCPQSPGCAIGNPVYASSSGIVELALVVSDSTQTLCDGSSTAGYKVNPNTSNLGNVVVVAHPNGKFTLYGHMDCIWPGIIPGLQVSTGTRIGNMGHSEFGERNGTFTPHTHFEMKDRAVTGDPTHEGYSGYVPDLPDGYGYHDARIYINPFSTTSISATAIKIVASSNQNVQTGPATGFAFLATVAPGQEFVAFASSGSWYQIYLPNSNGPISGWIEGGPALATPDPTATQIQVFGTGGAGLFIRPGPGATTSFVSWDETFSSCALAAKIWDGQRFVASANQSGWFQYFLPANHYFDPSNSCGVPVSPGPSLGWSSGSFLH
jgi:hypothetical protein